MPIIGIVIILLVASAATLNGNDDPKETCNVLSGECGPHFIAFSDDQPQDKIIDNTFISERYGLEVSVPSTDDWLIINNPNVMSLSNELPEIGDALDQIDDNIVQIHKKYVVDDNVIVDIFRQKNVGNYSVEELMTGLESMSQSYSTLIKHEGLELTTYGFETNLFPEKDMGIISYQQKICKPSTDECAHNLLITKYLMQEDYYYSITGALTTENSFYSDEVSSDMFYIINSVNLLNVK